MEGRQANTRRGMPLIENACAADHANRAQACRWHAGALAARRRFVADRAAFPALRLSCLHRLSRERSRRCRSVKARRAVSSPAAAGRPNPAP
jgi:hypothetical protein